MVDDGLSLVEAAPPVFVGDDAVVPLLPDALSLFAPGDSPAVFVSPSFFDSDLASPSLEDVDEAEFDRPPA